MKVSVLSSAASFLLDLSEPGADAKLDRRDPAGDEKDSVSDLDVDGVRKQESSSYEEEGDTLTEEYGELVETVEIEELSSNDEFLSSPMWGPALVTRILGADSHTASDFSTFLLLVQPVDAWEAHGVNANLVLEPLALTLTDRPMSLMFPFLDDFFGFGGERKDCEVLCLLSLRAALASRIAAKEPSRTTTRFDKFSRSDDAFSRSAGETDRFSAKTARARIRRLALGFSRAAA